MCCALWGAFIFKTWKHLYGMRSMIYRDMKKMQNSLTHLLKFVLRLERKLRSPSAQTTPGRNGWFRVCSRKWTRWAWQLPKTTRATSDDLRCQVQESPTGRRRIIRVSIRITEMGWNTASIFKSINSQPYLKKKKKASPWRMLTNQIVILKTSKSRERNKHLSCCSSLNGTSGSPKSRWREDST